jgi:hypothetical protein
MISHMVFFATGGKSGDERNEEFTAECDFLLDFDGSFKQIPWNMGMILV